MSLNLAAFLIESSKRKPNHTAVILDDFRMSYAGLHAASNRFADILVQAGVKPGDKVALQLPNVPQFLICYYGILKAGAVVVPLNILLKSVELVHRLSDSDAVAFVAWEGFEDQALPAFQQVSSCKNFFMVNLPGSNRLPVAQGVQNFDLAMNQGSPSFEAMQTRPDDTAVMLYASAYNGKPRGIELSHFNLFMNAQIVNHYLGITVGSDEVALVALPLFHSFGQSAIMNAGISAGITLTLMPRFDPLKAFALIERYKVTSFAGVPTMFLFLLKHPDRVKYDLSSLRTCASGGAALAPELFEEWQRVFGMPVLEGFGLSETSPIASFNIPTKPPRPGSVGVPVWGVDMKVVDEQEQEVTIGETGELVIRGHNVMKGYYKQPEATAEVLRDGWLHTGDYAKMDADGYFYIVGRKKDMVLRGGFNVYAREVEEVLAAHPAVAECAVIPVPDEILGEEVKAVVVLKTGQHATERELRDYCRERMAAYKYPRQIEIRVEPLPRNEAGQVLKKQL
jgi:long-chain acyl-CoA synthetase